MALCPHIPTNDLQPPSAAFHHGNIALIEHLQTWGTWARRPLPHDKSHASSGWGMAATAKKVCVQHSSAMPPSNDMKNFAWAAGAAR